MKTVLYICLAFTVFFSAQMEAQSFQGKATYRTSRKMSGLKVNDGKDAEINKQIQEQLRKQFQQEYTLAFNQQESIYTKNEKLEAPNPAPVSGIQIMISGGSDILYINTKENRYAQKTEIFGKSFLVKDKLKVEDWELTKDTKTIGAYVCFKAIRTEETRTQAFDSDTNGLKEVKANKIITAWYTPQIPIKTGPSNYSGLPGLILEVNDGKATIICSKIVMNPKGGVVIEEPTKGKVVTQERFDEIQDKKMKEMMEQHKSGRKGKKGHFSIRIEG
ncbi:MAG: GLPGLI family protein [Cellulophaga sp.]